VTWLTRVPAVDPASVGGKARKASHAP
jgi:hypothetical protein